MNIKEIFITVTNLREDWINPMPPLLKHSSEGIFAFIVFLICLITVITSPIWFIPQALYMGVRDYRLSRNLDWIDSPFKARMILKPCIHREEITSLRFYVKIINHAIKIIAKDENRTPTEIWYKYYRSYEESK